MVLALSVVVLPLQTVRFAVAVVLLGVAGVGFAVTLIAVLVEEQAPEVAAA